MKAEQAWYLKRAQDRASQDFATRLQIMEEVWDMWHGRVTRVWMYDGFIYGVIGCEFVCTLFPRWVYLLDT